MKWYNLFFLLALAACSSKKTVATETARLLSMDKIEQWDITIEPVKAPENLFAGIPSLRLASPRTTPTLPDFRPVHIKATKHTAASGSTHEQKIETKQRQPAQSAISTFPSKRQLFVGFIIVIVMFFVLRLARRSIGY